ncbi:MAG: GTP-binding protein [Methanophagales archaeon]|nr:GTP-binding protein [Methanophagales archaeon]MCW7073634.1 GTP-binding protein [Methanophagales archaeon]
MSSNRSSIDEDIKQIEDEIRRTPYNKATSHHIGRLKAKLARLRERKLAKATATATGKGTGTGFDIKRAGDATVAMVGFPSVGKSTLLNRLTNANAEVASYDFTTLRVIPGTLHYKGTRIQILDVPGLIQGASYGRGRGKEVISALRNADLILFILDITNNAVKQHEILARELYNSGIRINSRPPNVSIHKLSRGGIRIESTVEVDEDFIRAVLAEYRIHNAEVIIREREPITPEEFIDAVIGNRKYLDAITVINKIDLAEPSMLESIRKRYPDAVFISAEGNINLEALKERIYAALGFIQIYMKPQGAPPDMHNPLVLRRYSTVADACAAIHRDFLAKFRYAQIWGRSVKYAGQRVGLTHVLADGDIVSIVLRR